MRPAMPSALMWAPEIGAPETRQVKLDPRPALVPFLACTYSPGPIPLDFTTNR